MILVDSNVWLGLLMDNDSLHERSSRDFNDLVASRQNLVLSDHVVSEVATCLLNKIGKNAAEQFFQLALGSKELRIHCLTTDEVREVSERFRRSGRKLSFTDEVLLFLSDKYGYRLLTYDKDLAKAK